ncbi:MAG: hypothetical protein V1792_28205 [Pseudomonadota bacterium]
MGLKRESGKSGSNVVQFPPSKAKRPRANPKEPNVRLQHTNRKGKTYYLHVGKTKKGNDRYWFSTKDSGDTVETVPEGYEIYENPNAMVFLRKSQPKEIREEEIALLDAEVKAHAESKKYIIDTRGKVVTIFWTSQSGDGLADLNPFFRLSRMQEWYEQNAHFMPVFRFTLVDAEERLFIAERFCFRGRVDGWKGLFNGGPDPLRTLAERYVRHLGEDSFYELF